MRITAKKFKAATGHAPEQDDLERCNCKKAGQTFHMMCGWDKARDLPNFWPKLPQSRVGEIMRDIAARPHRS